MHFSFLSGYRETNVNLPLLQKVKFLLFVYERSKSVYM